MSICEWSADEISRRVDPELGPQLASTLPPHLPDGPITAELVRELDDRLQHEPVVRTAQVQIIAGPEGDELELRVHELAGDEAIFWIHGGGFFLGSADREDPICLALSEQLGVSVVAVDYRLAPEHPYPAALEDCYAALRWLGERFARIVVVGESAGGGLAGGLSLLARDRETPAISAQALLSPMLDDRSSTAGARMLGSTAVWNRRLNELGWRSYLGAQPADGYAAAGRADDLAGLPPTYLEVGELDLFRDDVIAFAAKLAAAGVTVELHVDPGVVHGFDRLAPDATISRIARERRARFVRHALPSGTRDRHSGAPR